MVLVDGEYCHVLKADCLAWADPDNNGVNGPVRCLEFKFPTECLSDKTKKHLKFCIDQYEFPNNKGSIPFVMVSLNEMKLACEIINKRLCTDQEWTLACEGPERFPYPYGYQRKNVCNIDRPWIAPNESVLESNSQDIRDQEISRLDQRVPSGSNPECVSPFGVYDMTGNVDENTINTSGRPYHNSLKGGDWPEGSRNRCRPATLIHNETFRYYQIGGRCCSDPLQL